MFANFNDGLGDPFDFPELDTPSLGHSIRAATTNNVWPLVVAAGISAVGGILAAKASDKGSAAVGGDKILPNTVSGNEVSSQDFLFDIESVKAMQDLTTSMSEWSGQDRDFFKNTFEPFQESLVQSNQELLPSIVKNSSTALQQNLNDMFDSTALKDQFRTMSLASGERIGDFSEKFAEQVDKIPTAEQRIGQAISGVEQRFGQAGAELKRQMGAKGLDVSEAGIREMMIGKATAKAGAAQQAGEAARKEMLDATAQATGVFSTVQQSQTAQLTAERGLVQSGATLMPQVGGVKDQESVGAAGAIEAQLTAQESGKQLGTASEKKDAEFTQKGVQVPKFFDKETGNVITAGGEDVKSMELTYEERLAKALADQRNALLSGRAVGGADDTNSEYVGGPGADGLGAPGGLGPGGVGIGGNSGPSGGGPSSPGPAGSSGDTGDD